MLKTKKDWTRLLGMLIAASFIFSIILYWQFRGQTLSPETVFKKTLINNFETKQVSLNFLQCSSSTASAVCQPASKALEGFDFENQIYYLEVNHPPDRLFSPDKIPDFDKFKLDNNLNDVWINLKIYQPASEQSFVNFQLSSKPELDNLVDKLNSLRIIKTRQVKILEAGWLPEIKDDDIDQNLNLTNFINPQNLFFFGLIPKEDQPLLIDLASTTYQPDYTTVRQYTSQEGSEIYEYDVTVDHKKLKDLNKQYAKSTGTTSSQPQINQDIKIVVRINANSHRIVSYDQKMSHQTYLRRKVVGFNDDHPWIVKQTANIDPQYFYEIVARLYDIDQEEARLEFLVE